MLRTLGPGFTNVTSASHRLRMKAKTPNPGIDQELIDLLCADCAARLTSMGEAHLESLGFPSPADIYLEHRLDISRRLVPHPASTYFARMAGDAMREEGIRDGDLLVIDRSEPVVEGNIVVVRIEQAMVVRKLVFRDGRMFLDSGAHDPIELLPDLDYELWGRVMHSVRRH